jgi:SET and MYND domain-containing protein 4
MNLKKNNLEANELRLAGNEHYKSCRFYEALLCYNKSLCNAIPGSKEFSMGFANRSAVYMEVEEYELCLENIKLAIDCGYPEDSVEKLLERQEKCLDLLEVHEPNRDDNPWQFFKLSHAASKTIPFMASCIELRESKTFGRHLVTTQDLKAGEIVCIEEPFHKFPLNSSRVACCANCLKSEKLNLFPCCECNYSKWKSHS